ncbi:hypothetical protein SJZ72_27490, partial [Klebsiella pneumoniae]|uniref:hypothetical protein n=1 Tax=Klebsiella pneumoniae TaxID=573 RepID=UPI0029D5F2A0
FVRGKLIDLWGFVLLALTFFASSAAVSAMTLLGENVMGWLGLRSSVAGWLLAAGALLLVAALDAFLIWLIIRVISKVRVPWPDMRQG